MSLFKSKTAIKQYRVVAEDAQEGKNITQLAFQPIDEVARAESVGFVDPLDPERFTELSRLTHEDNRLFAMRQDRRKIPPSVVKRHLAAASAAFLAEHPGLKRVPKGKKEAMLEAVIAELLPKTYPIAKVTQFCISSTSAMIFTSSARECDTVTDLFRLTAPGLRFVPIAPIDIAYELLGEKAAGLDEGSKDDDYLLRVSQNSNLGAEFLKWLAWKTDTDNDGSAYICEKVVLKDDGGKVAVSGPEFSFTEIKSALLAGKSIVEAHIVMEKGEDVWSFNLDAETFDIKSMKTPSVVLDKAADDEELERLAVCTEKLALIETGLNLFREKFKRFLEYRTTAPSPMLPVIVWYENAD